MLGYVKTQNIDIHLARARGLDTQVVWDSRHEWGATRVVEMLEKLSGFYIKVNLQLKT